MVWFAARIFCVGVLMYVKPPTPLELVKWIRYRWPGPRLVDSFAIPWLIHDHLGTFRGTWGV